MISVFSSSPISCELVDQLPRTSSICTMQSLYTVRAIDLPAHSSDG